MEQRALGELIDESQNLHLDAMRVGRDPIGDLADDAADRRRDGASQRDATLIGTTRPRSDAPTC